MKEYLYLIEDKTREGMTTKIGITDNPKERLRQIRISNPHPVTLRYLYASSDAERLEALLHSYFAELHLTGEWYKCRAKDIAAVVERLAQPQALSVAEPEPKRRFRDISDLSDLYREPWFSFILKAALVVYVALGIYTLATTWMSDKSFIENIKPVMDIAMQAAIFYAAQMLAHLSINYPDAT